MRAIKDIKSANPESKGRLEFLELDLADLPTVKKAADEFMSRESRLDVLTNNAGIWPFTNVERSHLISDRSDEASAGRKDHTRLRVAGNWRHHLNCC